MKQVLELILELCRSSLAILIDENCVLSEKHFWANRNGRCSRHFAFVHIYLTQKPSQRTKASFVNLKYIPCSEIGAQVEIETDALCYFFE